MKITGSISMNIKWGLYPWFIEHGTELIHPDDLEKFRKETNNCKVFQCIEEGNYITLKYNDRLYRVKDNLFRPVPIPKFDFGEKIEIVKNKEKVIITDIMWHYKKQEHYYFVSSQNRKKSKRYFGEELIYHSRA